VARGSIDLKSFITHHYPLEKTVEAIELAKTGGAMKIIIDIKKQQ
jgi:Zn-dependent alcohol dehydrogenase